jgi:hypothetical protein
MSEHDIHKPVPEWMEAEREHEVLLRVVAFYLGSNRDKKASTATIRQLVEWSADRAMEGRPDQERRQS